MYHFESITTEFITSITIIAGFVDRQMIRPQQVVLIIILIVSEFVKGSKNIYVLKVVLTSGGPFYNPDHNMKKYFLPNYKEFLILDHF